MTDRRRRAQRMQYWRHVDYVYVIVLALTEPSSWMRDGPRRVEKNPLMMSHGLHLRRHRMQYWRHADYIYVIMLALTEPSSWMTDGPRRVHRMRYWRRVDYTSSVWFKWGFSFRIQNDDSLHCKAGSNINKPVRFIGDAVILPTQFCPKDRNKFQLQQKKKFILKISSTNNKASVMLLARESVCQIL